MKNNTKKELSSLSFNISDEYHASLFGPNRNGYDGDDNIYKDIMIQIYNNFNIDKVNLFTFVREPMAHFNSGLREYYYRNWILNNLQEVVNKTETETETEWLKYAHKLKKYNIFENKTVTKSQLMLLIKQTLYANDTGTAYGHVFPQSSTFNSLTNVDIIGKMENFNLDWIEIMSYYNLTNESYNPGLSKHMSSSDPNGIIKIWNELPNNYLRSICVLLSVDYLCFNYNLPSYCEDLLWRIEDIFDKEKIEVEVEKVEFKGYNIEDTKIIPLVFCIIFFTCIIIIFWYFNKCHKFLYK
jgi:hypothetical protein